MPQTVTIREMSWNCQGISHCLESGHPVVYITSSCTCSRSSAYNHCLYCTDSSRLVRCSEEQHHLACMNILNVFGRKPLPSLLECTVTLTACERHLVYLLQCSIMPFRAYATEQLTACGFKLHLHQIRFAQIQLLSSCIREQNSPLLCLYVTSSDDNRSNNVLIKVTLSRQRHCRGTVLLEVAICSILRTFSLPDNFPPHIGHFPMSVKAKNFRKLTLIHTPDPNQSTSINFVHHNSTLLYIVDWQMVWWWWKWKIFYTV